MHYLKQFGLPLECNKVDFSKFYRHFVLVAAAVPSHMQIWTDEEDGTHLVKDDRMNFGDAAAANISSRLTGLVVWCLHLVTDKLCPVALAAADSSQASPRWRRLITTDAAASSQLIHRRRHRVQQVGQREPLKQKLFQQHDKTYQRRRSTDSAAGIAKGFPHPAATSVGRAAAGTLLPRRLGNPTTHTPTSLYV